MNDTPPTDEILAQRDRLLASQVFASSKRLSRFLDYLVTEALSGDPPQLKEMVIGIEVFDRDATFDPRIDSIVRVEAGRLRGKLREYYELEGRDDPVRISIPKGAYVPAFAPMCADRSEAGAAVSAGSGRATPPERSGHNAGGLVGMAALALAVLVLAAFVFLRERLPPASAELAPPHTVAVLPLRDWSERPEDYFSEAMTDALIGRLSERPELRVTSLASVMVYKNTDAHPSEIGTRLGVGHIVEGTILREADRVRIAARLIDAQDGRNLWSRTVERPMTSVLELQQGVAAEIAAQLAGELLPAPTAAAATIEPAAYEAFLKGRYWRNRLTAHGFSRGIQYFERAIELAPGYAEAYAGLAACHCQLGGHGIEVVAPRVALPEARQLAGRALELDATLAEPNAVLGIIKFKFEWDADGAQALLARAIEKNPSLFYAHLWRSQVSEGLQRHEQAVDEARIAHTLNPLSLAANLNLGWQLYQAGAGMEAERQFDTVLEFDPEFWGGHWGKGHCYRARGQYPEAIAAFARAVELQGGHSLPMAALGYTHGVVGDREAARAVLDALLAMSRDGYVSPVHIAMVYAGLSETDAAFEWLDGAYTARARSLAWLAVTREFDGLRADPRYAALLSAIGIGG